jgi:FK506-binding nuclear protein
LFLPHFIIFRESYGEDIADTETERSANGSDEDEYEGSFINDDEDPEIMSPSTVYSSEGNL